MRYTDKSIQKLRSGQIVWQVFVYHHRSYSDMERVEMTVEIYRLVAMGKRFVENIYGQRYVSFGTDTRTPHPRIKGQEGVQMNEAVKLTRKVVVKAVVPPAEGERKYAAPSNSMARARKNRWLRQGMKPKDKKEVQ